MENFGNILLGIWGIIEKGLIWLVQFSHFGSLKNVSDGLNWFASLPEITVVAIIVGFLLFKNLIPTFGLGKLLKVITFFLFLVNYQIIAVVDGELVMGSQSVIDANLQLMWQHLQLMWQHLQLVGQSILNLGQNFMNWVQVTTQGV